MKHFKTTKCQTCHKIISAKKRLWPRNKTTYAICIECVERMHRLQEIFDDMYKFIDETYPKPDKLTILYLLEKGIISTEPTCSITWLDN